MLLHLFCNTHFFLFQSCLDASFFVLSTFLLSNKALSFFNRQRGCDFGQNNGNFRAPSHSRVVSGIFKILQCGPISKGVSQNSSCFFKVFFFFWYENFCGLDYNRASFRDFHNFRVTNLALFEEIKKHEYLRSRAYICLSLSSPSHR